MENATEIIQCVCRMQYISLLPKYIKLNSGGVFSCGFACVNVGH